MKEVYERLVNNLNDEKVIELMRKLGADRHIEKDDYIIFPTICHNIDSNDASMKLYYYKDNKFFYCYTEDGGMSIFNFLKVYYETRQYEYNWYEDILRLVENCSNGVSIDSFETIKTPRLKDRYGERRKEVVLETYPEGILEVFTKLYPTEWLEDNISKEAMDKFNILYSISQNKIIIPHYDINGKLIGIRGRALNDWEIKNIGKYMPIKIENKWYSHKLSFNLYGLNHTIENIRKNKYVYIFESEDSLLSAFLQIKQGRLDG